MDIKLLDSTKKVKQQSENKPSQTQNVRLRMIKSLSTNAIIGINLLNYTKNVNTTTLN